MGTTKLILLDSLLQETDTMPENYTRPQVLDMIKEKEILEDEIKGLTEVLTSQGVGMDEPLVDAEGFPRADIDVYQVRHARHAIRTKGNDLKACLAKIEHGLHNLHAQAREGGGMEAAVERLEIDDSTAPFARVLVVTQGSLAEKAGFKAEDLITRFGSVNVTNFTSIKSISEVVEHSTNREVSITIIRDGSPKKLNLTCIANQPLGFKLRPVSIDADR